jgi:hypothetical protein
MLKLVITLVKPVTSYFQPGTKPISQLPSGFTPLVAMLSISVEVSQTLVREFYANMHDFQDGTFQFMLWRKPILVSLALIRELTSTPLVDDSPYLWSLEQASSHMEVVATLGVTSHIAWE